VREREVYMHRLTGENLGRRTSSWASTATLVILMAVLTAVGAQVAIPLPFTPVPITLQVLVVVLSGFLLGARGGASAQLTYLALGAIGAPVFAGFTGGFWHLLGPTGGYLISYPFAAAVAGFAFPIVVGAPRWRAVAVATVAGLLGLGVIYALGTAWLAFELQLSLGTAITQAVLPFLAVDIAKIALAALVAAGAAPMLRSRFL
jgi:biotin transport system substrate-specific component